MSSVEVVPTHVPAALVDFIEAAERVRAFAPIIHLDVVDGVFAPNLTWPYGEGQYEELVAAAERGALLPDLPGMGFDVHLMTEDPREAGVLFARAGARRVIGHIEAFENVEEARAALEAWRAHGAQAGLCILFDTPEEAIEPVAEALDLLQVMTIAVIGKQGAPFERRAIDRVARFHAAYPELPIGVDGGVGSANIAELARAGASIFSVGAAIARAEDPQAMYAELLKTAGSHSG